MTSVLVAALACGSRTPPRVLSFSVVPAQGSQLSGVATFDAVGAECARLLWTSDSDAAGQTACVSPSSGQLNALGLKPATDYRLTLELQNSVGTTRSQEVTYSSPDLPDDLKALKIAVSGTAGPGLTLTGLNLGANSYVLAFDGSGTIRWYQSLPSPAFIDAQQLPNGDFSVFAGSSSGWTDSEGAFVQMHPTGELVASYAVDLPDYLDPHELRATFDQDGVPTFHYFTYVIEPWDLTAFGGTATSPLAIHSLVRQRLGEARQVVWDAHGRVTMSDRIEGPSPLYFPDLVHPNSIDFDLDGNYVVSMRDLGEVQKIDAVTGETLWRLGGAHNDFTFVGDPKRGFSAQHCARIMQNGNVLLYDNGTRHSPAETRVVEYALDLQARTATLVLEYRHATPIYTPFMGSVQRLETGNTQVGFSMAGIVNEVDPGGKLVWEAALSRNGTNVQFYRAVRIGALDSYKLP